MFEHINQFYFRIMGKNKKYNRPVTPRTELKIVKLVRVSTSHTLQEIVQESYYQIKSIISIYRVYSFEEQKATQDIYIAMRNEVEYRALLEAQVLWIGTDKVDVAFAEWGIGCGTMPSDSTIVNFPVCMMIQGLRKVSKVPTFYIAKLLEELESDKIIGISVVYDEKRDCIKPYGFVAFASKEAAALFNNKSFKVYNEPIICTYADRVPAIVTSWNKALLGKGIQQKYTNELHRANLLCAIPAVLPPHMRIEVNEGVKSGTQDDASDESDTLSLHFDEDLE